MEELRLPWVIRMGVQKHQNNYKPERVKWDVHGQRQRGRICYVALTLHFIFGPCVVFYLLLLCFCPTSSVYTHSANYTLAKLIENIHTYKQTVLSASVLAPSWHGYNTLWFIQSELSPEAIFQTNQKKGFAGRPLWNWMDETDTMRMSCLTAFNPVLGSHCNSLTWMT